MNSYLVEYVTKNGFKSEVIVAAASRVCAYEVFESLGFEDVVSAEVTPVYFDR